MCHLITINIMDGDGLSNKVVLPKKTMMYLPFIGAVCTIVTRYVECFSYKGE